MRHVDHEERADLVSHGADAREVDGARVGGAAGDDQFRSFRAGELFQLLVVDAPVFPAHAVLHRAEPFARQIGRGAVRQVAAGGEAHAEHGIARLQQGQEYRLVGLRAGVRLDIGEAAAE